MSSGGAVAIANARASTVDLTVITIIAGNGNLSALSFAALRFLFESDALDWSGWWENCCSQKTRSLWLFLLINRKMSGQEWKSIINWISMCRMESSDDSLVVTAACQLYSYRYARA